MDDGGQRENGRYKTDQYRSAQWMVPQHHLKENQTIKLIMAERDKALQERDLALSEKKAALVERDMAYLQRDAAIAERNNAIVDRDNAIAALEYTRENGMSVNRGPGCPTGHHGNKHMYQQHHHHIQHIHPSPEHSSDASYNQKKEPQSEAFPISTASETGAKALRAKRARKETKVQTSPSKRKTSRKSKRGGGDNLSKQVTIAKTAGEWRGEVVGEDITKQVSMTKHHEWRSQDLGLNQVSFDDSTMPVPVCSCTGKFRQCYKWGNGGWQSACCTTTLSMYPLPVMPNKRHARVGGRKMSGGAFRKLLSRLAAEGHDLSLPVDLREHWAKHGTNRYITIR